jgi:DNA processing protein
MNTTYTIKKLELVDYPGLLNELRRAPKSLEYIGTLPPDHMTYLCVVGSRAYSEYGREVCEHLIAGLKGYPIVIVSGLAIGIDSIAHRAALAHNLITIAFPGSGLDDKVLYPAQHINLAREIVDRGGALISPFHSMHMATDWTFPQRNILMAGISHAVLVIEAADKSGTLITARCAIDEDRDVFIVPGSIFSPLSHGGLRFIKDGAIPVTSSQDILEALGLATEDGPQQNNLFSVSNPDQEKIIQALGRPISRDDLLLSLKLPTGYVQSILNEFELEGLLTEQDGLLHFSHKSCNTNVQ